MILSRSKWTEIVVGLVVIAAFGFLIWLGLQIKGGASMHSARYHLIFDNAVGLLVDNPVTIAGVKVGRIEAINVQQDRARVTVALRQDIQLHEDSSASIRAKSLLGEKYIELFPGTSAQKLVEIGQTITKTAPTVDIDQVIRRAGGLMKRATRWVEAFENEDSEFSLAELFTAINRFSAMATTLAPSFEKQVPELLGNLNRSVKSFSAYIETANIEDSVSDAKIALKEAKDVLSKLNNILDKVKDIDESTIRKLVQIDGVRIRLTADPSAKKRLEELRESHSS